jgi:hypothetical protein
MAQVSKAWVCGRSLAGIAGSNLAGGMDVFLLLSVVCCQVEVTVTGLSLVQRSPTECGLSEYDRKSLDNEKALAHQRLPKHGKRKFVLKLIINVFYICINTLRTGEADLRF